MEDKFAYLKALKELKANKNKLDINQDYINVANCRAYTVFFVI